MEVSSATARKTHQLARKVNEMKLNLNNTTKPETLETGFQLLTIARKAMKQGEETPKPILLQIPTINIPETLTTELREVLVDALESAAIAKVRSLRASSTVEIDSDAFSLQSLVAWQLAASSSIKLDATALQDWFLRSSIAATIRDEQMAAGKSPDAIPAMLANIAIRFGKLAAPTPALSRSDAEAMLRRAQVANDTGKELAFCVRKLESMLKPAEAVVAEGL